MACSNLRLWPTPQGHGYSEGLSNYVQKFEHLALDALHVMSVCTNNSVGNDEDGEGESEFRELSVATRKRLAKVPLFLLGQSML